MIILSATGDQTQIVLRLADMSRPVTKFHNVSSNNCVFFKFVTCIMLKNCTFSSSNILVIVGWGQLFACYVSFCPRFL